MTTTHPTSPSRTPHPPPVTATQHRRHHWWRWVAGVLAVLLVLFVGSAWYFSGRIESQALASNPTSFPPAYDDVQVVAVNHSELTLEKGPDAWTGYDTAAIYGMAWDGGTGLLGPGFVNADGSVTRELHHLSSGTPPTAGQMAALDRAYWLDYPNGSSPEGFTSNARSIYPEPTEVVFGDGYPAWYFKGPDESLSSMAIVVHGQNGSRVDGLRAVEALMPTGVPILDITYRNDVGAPADPSARLQYGVTEWRDLDAAVTWARGQGANDVILIGQSMGGAIVASFLEHSAQADAVSKVILDAPMLSLGDVVAHGARDAMPLTGGPVPEPILWAAEQLTTLRYGVDWSAVDYLDDTSWVQAPTLVLHGTADPTVPVALSEELAAAEPDLVTLQTFPRALHVESWNFDPGRYDDIVRSFLSPTG